MKARKSLRAMQNSGLPTFDNPPVIETVIGVQFDQIPNLTSAHFGWYWREFLGGKLGSELRKRQHCQVNSRLLVKLSRSFPFLTYQP